MKHATKIFLDGGDANETREIIDILGFIDGQTTNPTLIAKNPYVSKRINDGEKFTRKEIQNFYRKVVKEISEIIPNGSVSIEVYSDYTTNAGEMISEAREMSGWIPNAWIKYPITKEGLKAAEISVQEGMRVNMTLCFSQEQAAAVYAATKGAKSGNVFVSPFVGRLDDQKKNGMDLIKNIMKMYKNSDGHVEVLTASVRNIDHMYTALALESNIITAPMSVLKKWHSLDITTPNNKNRDYTKKLEPIEYLNIDLNKNWKEYNIEHNLTKKGLENFVSDWQHLIQEL